jgi:hypothetical protein
MGRDNDHDLTCFNSGWSLTVGTYWAQSRSSQQRQGQALHAPPRKHDHQGKKGSSLGGDALWSAARPRGLPVYPHPLAGIPVRDPGQAQRVRLRDPAPCPRAGSDDWGVSAARYGCWTLLRTFTARHVLDSARRRRPSGPGPRPPQLILRFPADFRPRRPGVAKSARHIASHC